jgi:hypothetical protein
VDINTSSEMIQRVRSIIGNEPKVSIRHLSFEVTLGTYDATLFFMMMND